MAVSPGAGRRVALLLAGLVAGCSATLSTSPPELEPVPARATVRQGPFEATFDVTRSALRPGDAIDGTATLRLVAGGAVPFSSSGSGVFAFSFREVGGQGRSVAWLRQGDCTSSSFAADTPMISPIRKSGSYGDGPEDAFARAFLNDPVIRLPAGFWDITANAAFVHGDACDGDKYSMDVTVRVQVVE